VAASPGRPRELRFAIEKLREARATTFRIYTKGWDALRGHVGEFGFVAPQGIAHASKLGAWIRSPDCSLPEAAQAICLILVEMIDRLSEQISQLNVEIARRARRDFAAWMGLTPRQHSSGGKIRLGKTSQMGHRDLRRLLIIGASAVVRWASRRKGATSPWLARMLERKPPMLVIMALANKMARICERLPLTVNVRSWALMANGSVYRTGHGTVATG